MVVILNHAATFLIEGCTFSTGDDAIAIKSGRDNDAWRIGQPTENVVIRNCTFWSKINGMYQAKYREVYVMYL